MGTKQPSQDSLLSNRRLLLISSIYLQGQRRAGDLLLNCIRCPLPPAKTGLCEACGEILRTSSHCALGTARLKALRGKAGVTTRVTTPHLHLPLLQTVKLLIRLPPFVYVLLRQSCSVALAGLEPHVQTAESGTSAVKTIAISRTPASPHCALLTSPLLICFCGQQSAQRPLGAKLQPKSHWLLTPNSLSDRRKTCTSNQPVFGVNKRTSET